jgi:hypothetical protein
MGRNVIRRAVPALRQPAQSFERVARYLNLDRTSRRRLHVQMEVNP